MPSADNFDLPLAKRQKRVSQVKAGTRGSKIFAPFRTLGLVSPTPVPFTSVRLGKSTFQITTSVGHSLQTYDLRRGLNLIFLSRPQTPEIITATCAWQDKVFAAWGHLRSQSAGGVWVFKRGKRVAVLEGPTDLKGPIERLVVFGSWVVGCWVGGLEVWKTGTYEHYASLRPQSARGSSGEKIYTGIMCNMPTYLNKIFVGRSDGAVDIWNLRSGKLIHTLPSLSADSGPVTAIHPTPALSLVAIAYKGGALAIQNVSSGQLVLSLKNASSRGLPVTSITFRGDGLGAGHDGRSSGVMATASSGSGDITLWDLNNGGRIAGILRGAHRMSSGEKPMGANRVEFLDGQPVLVSSGDDNSLKTWIFDETPFSPIPRPLHRRNGHSAAVSALDFLPTSSDGSESGGKWLLSASKDCSLWGLSLRKDSQHTEISQGSLERKAKKQGPSNISNTEDLKAPEVTCIACSLNRDGGMGVTTSGPIWSNPKVTNADASNATGWESVVTGHRGDKFARTWFWGKKKAGRWAFATSDGTEVKSVAVSQCGTFAVIGSAGGSIDMFNMQSGLHRQSFPARPPAGRATKSNAQTLIAAASKHTKAVTGLMIDSLNRTVVSCGLDGKVKFWDLLSGKFIDELDWHPMAAITGLRYNKASELVAFSCDDLSIRVIDLETRKLVREFWGCVGQVNDFIFSNDGRWIVAASMDSVVRVWDMPTGHLIDIFRVSSTCVALAMSSTGEFLATAHAGSIGISLWSNRSLFMPVSTKNLDENVIENVGLPATSGEGGAGLIEAAFVNTTEQDEAEGPVLATEQLQHDMMTLSLVPKSRWQSLLHLDTIRERNRPTEAPKAPEKAPFFLPSLLGSSGPEIVSEIPGTEDTDAGSVAKIAEAERLRIAKLQTGGNASGPQSIFTRSLASGHDSSDFSSFIDHLKTLSPAKADLEIRSLDPRLRDGHSELSDFVIALTARLQSKRDFELVHAWMAVFLKIHADTVSLSSTQDEPQYRLLQEALAIWSAEQQREGKRLAELVGYCRGVVGFLRSAR
ncbi:SnoRNA binding protein, putative [Penicillium digitatum]|uniref:SnoRNA binding protein, putative n=3 Tax=Penicillium digitatum TaxID=36651 RepID=K9FP37_PEND2|nr:SnoRNA binding protein, putative [Penicillium digitatum Pd1]EKV08509.1 SnoRNA binding protein, putative [Penicillium digitatum Pd1]EKV10162.1 SnoRNA binding protein, putative [Penicillium digitatum PHI26]QQK41773.1 SnoRNA binding protein, putative [Penicillium digitatum]